MPNPPAMPGYQVLDLPPVPQEQDHAPPAHFPAQYELQNSFRAGQDKIVDFSSVAPFAWRCTHCIAEGHTPDVRPKGTGQCLTFYDGGKKRCKAHWVHGYEEVKETEQDGQLVVRGRHRGSNKCLSDCLR